jgi:hypothetical protein
MKNVEIFGAGLSGLTAGIALAREGYRVVVFDAQNSIGGSPAFHPSVHTTPAQLDELMNYVGIDLRKDFVKTDPYPTFYYRKTPLKFPPYTEHNTAYCIERGSRATSIDNHLFAIAREAGVGFEFKRKIDFSAVKPDTIVATGLAPEMYESLGVPFRMIYGMWSWREIKDETATGSIFMGPFTPEYGYTAQVNGLDYALLFSTKSITKDDENTYKNILKSLGGGEYPEPWKSVKMAVPADVRLFSNGLILAGTLSGMMEPFWGYGIVGAIISGKLAAKAIIDRKEAEKDFALFTRGFHAKFMKRKNFSAHSAPVREILIKTALCGARLQCLWNKELAGKPREPLRWFR